MMCCKGLFVDSQATSALGLAVPSRCLSRSSTLKKCRLLQGTTMLLPLKDPKEGPKSRALPCPSFSYLGTLLVHCNSLPSPLPTHLPQGLCTCYSTYKVMLFNSTMTLS